MEGLKQEYEIFSTGRGDCRNAYLGNFTYQDMDVTDRESVLKTAQQFEPDVIIHSAAYTNVDGAEKEQELCRKINEDGSRFVAEAAADISSRLIAVSTDYVFDGKAGPYGEQDATHPLGWYGQTKFLGEQAIQKVIPEALICRTMAVFGFAPHITRFNFVGWLISQLEQGKPVNVVSDQMTNHSLADDLARVLVYLAGRDVKGIIHTAGEDWLSRYDFALRVAEFFDWNTNLITPVSAAELGWTADRPLQGGLRMDQLHELGIGMMTTTEQLEVVQETFSWKQL